MSNNGNDNGRITIRDVEERLRKVEVRTNVIIAVMGGQLFAMSQGTSIPSVIIGLFT